MDPNLVLESKVFRDRLQAECLGDPSIYAMQLGLSRREGNGCLSFRLVKYYITRVLISAFKFDKDWRQVS